MSSNGPRSETHYEDYPCDRPWDPNPKPDCESCGDTGIVEWQDVCPETGLQVWYSAWCPDCPEDQGGSTER